MRVLLTGAAGNLGGETLPLLLERGHHVRTFDLDTPENRKQLAPFAGRVELCWGDITREADVRTLASEIDAILHNAAITPPMSEQKPEHAYRVNVTGTRHLIDAALRQPRPPRFLFASSIATFGVTQPLVPPPRRSDSELTATDHYSAHKIECERHLRESGLSFCIFRIGASPPVNPKGGDPSLLKFMFERTLKSRVEYVHPRDVGLAQVRALEVDEAWGKVLLIGGGTGCQITNRELINDLLTEVGIGALPDTAFAEKYLYGDWLDTTESQRLLDFQKHTYGDFLREVSSNIGFKRFGMGLVRPFVRRLLLSHSDAYKASRAR